MGETATVSAGPASPEQLAGRLIELVTELAVELQPSLETGTVRLESVLDRELGLDSLSRVELLMRLERRFDVRLNEEELAAAETVSELLHLVQHGGRRQAWSVEPAPQLDRRESSRDAPQEIPTSAETVVEVLEWHAERHGEQTLILLYGDGDEATTVTYGDLREAAMETAAGLRGAGLAPGQAVAIMLPTGLDYFAIFYGALYAGLIPVPLYPPVRPSQIEDHLRRQVRILDNCRARLLITVPEAKAAARLLRSQVATLGGIATMAEIRAQAEGAPRVAHRGKGQDLAFLQYTSGSTGQPKGVALSHHNLLTNIRAMTGSVNVGADDVFVSWLPLYHDMGLIGAGMGSLFCGFLLVLMSPLAFLSRPSRWLQTISRHRGTVSGGPNFAYELCLSKIPDSELEGVDLSSWRLAFNGAEPVVAETLERFAERFAAYGFRPEALLPVYGLAENTLGVAFPPAERLPVVERIDRRAVHRESRATPAATSDETALRFVGCGVPLPGHQVRIADDGGHELPERAVGRVQFRGPSACRGYYRNPEQTRQLFVGDWLDSGDLGYMVGGELFLTGRSKDLIIKAGRNLSPYEIEEAVGKVEGVRKGCVAVFGAAESAREGSSATGERLVVLAETRSESVDEKERLRREILAVTTDVVGLAPDEVVLAPPRTVLKTSSGKIRRAASRELYLEGRVGRARPSVFRQFLSLGLSSVVPLLRRAGRATGAVAYTLWMWLALAGVALPLLPVVVALPGVRSRQTLTRWAARSLFFLGGLRLRVQGLEHLPREGPYIVAVNHCSYTDALVLAATLLPGAGIVAKRELGMLPFARWALRRIGVDLVERFDREQSVEDSRRILERLRRGEALVFFPEGTFTRIPGLLPFRMGTFVNAVEAEAAVVPGVIHGTRSLLRADEWLLRRAPLSLSLYPPIRPEGADWSAAVRLRDAVRRQILAHVAEPDLESEREEGFEKLRAQRAG